MTYEKAYQPPQHSISFFSTSVYKNSWCFPCFFIKKYIADQSHIIDWNNVQLELEGEFHA